MQKGQTELFEYILTFLFGLIILAAVSTIIYSLYSNALSQDMTNSMNEVSLEVSDAILKLYQQGQQSTASPANSTSILIATLNLNLPSKISNRNYEVDLFPITPLFGVFTNITLSGRNFTYVIQTSGAKIVVQSTENPKIAVTKDLPNINLNIQGTITDGVNATLNYYRYNINGTVYDKIVLGGQPIIIDINKIS